MCETGGRDGGKGQGLRNPSRSLAVSKGMRMSARTRSSAVPTGTFSTETRLTDVRVFGVNLDCIFQNQSPYVHCVFPTPFKAESKPASKPQQLLGLQEGAKGRDHSQPPASCSHGHWAPERPQVRGHVGAGHRHSFVEVSGPFPAPGPEETRTLPKTGSTEYTVSTFTRRNAVLCSWKPHGPTCARGGCGIRRGGQSNA